MKTVTKYIADDGKEFTKQEDCKNYEQNKWFVDIWEETDEDDCFWFECQNIYSGHDVLEFLSKHCIITKKLEIPNAKKVLNKGKNN